MHWMHCNITDFSSDALQQAYACLSPERKEHIDRFRRQEDKNRSLAAELLAQKLLREHYGIRDAVLHRHSNGQPYLTGCDLYVSISHSGEKVACALNEAPIGIDIEHIRPVKLNLMRQVCVEEELAYVLAGHKLQEELPCRNEEILQRFFEIWTAKEAYFKKCGTGITDLRSVNILNLPRQVCRIEDYVLHII